MGKLVTANFAFCWLFSLRRFFCRIISFSYHTINRHLTFWFVNILPWCNPSYRLCEQFLPCHEFLQHNNFKRTPFDLQTFFPLRRFFCQIISFSYHTINRHLTLWFVDTIDGSATICKFYDLLNPFFFILELCLTSSQTII